MGSQRFGHDGATEQQQQWWTVLGQYLLVLPQKDYRGTKYLIAHESKQRITVKKTKLIL